MSDLVYTTLGSGGKLHLTPLVDGVKDCLCLRLSGDHSGDAVRIVDGTLEVESFNRQHHDVFAWVLEYHPTYCLQCLRKAGFDLKKQITAYQNHPSFKVIFQELIAEHINHSRPSHRGIK